MRLLIRLDPRGRGIVIWIDDDSSNISPFVPGDDRLGLSQIDSGAIERLRDLLQIAEEGAWSSHGYKAVNLAKEISSCIEMIQSTSPSIFSQEPLFACPAPLAAAISVSTDPISISQWLSRFPPHSLSNS